MDTILIDLGPRRHPMSTVQDAMNTTPTTHVALIAFPFSSHPASLFALARSLAAAAPTASFSFLSTPRTLAPLAASLPNLRLHPVPDGCPSPPPANVDAQIGMFFGAAPGNIRTALEAASAEMPVSCVVSDAFVWLAAGVAEGMGVPWVPVWTANPAALWAHIHTDLIRATIAAAAGEESQGLAPGLHPAIRVKDLPLQVTSGDLHSGVAGLLYRMGQELHRGAALVTNTFPALDPSIDAGFREKFSNYLPMGPFDLLKPPPPPPGPDGNDESGCLPWLDRWPPNSVAYVSFSTIMAPPPAELAGLAEGLEASGVPFLWSLGEGLRQHLPAGFVERNKARGLVVAWAPQVRVLAHPAVGVLVNHCGWNSVMECVASGVPMACRPLLADNMMNERLLTRVLGVGVEFEGGVMSKESTVRALDTFFKAGGTDEGEKMRERMREIKGMAAAAVGDGGCSATNVSRLLQIASMHADPTYHQI